MPVRRQPVVGEPAGHPRKEEGGEVREHPRLGQDQETRVVRHHLQPPELLLRPPAAPPVARSALEGAVLPRRQAQPPVPEACHAAQAAGRQPLEAEMAALVHQRVPERALLRPGQPDLDVRQGKPRRHPAKRGMELEALANRHGRSIARPGRERQRKIPAPRSRAHATQTSPVSRKTSRNQRGMPLPPPGRGLRRPESAATLRFDGTSAASGPDLGCPGVWIRHHRAIFGTRAARSLRKWPGVHFGVEVGGRNASRH